MTYHFYCYVNNISSEWFLEPLLQQKHGCSGQHSRTLHVVASNLGAPVTLDLLSHTYHTSPSLQSEAAKELDFERTLYHACCAGTQQQRDDSYGGGWCSPSTLSHHICPVYSYLSSPPINRWPWRIFFPLENTTSDTRISVVSTAVMDRHSSSSFGFVQLWLSCVQRVIFSTTIHARSFF